MSFPFFYVVWEEVIADTQVSVSRARESGGSGAIEENNT